MELQQWRKKTPPMLHPVCKDNGSTSITMMVKYDRDPDLATLTQIMLRYANGSGRNFLVNSQMDVTTFKVVTRMDMATAVYACASHLSVMVLMVSLDSYNRYFNRLAIREPFVLSESIKNDLLRIKN